MFRMHTSGASKDAPAACVFNGQQLRYLLIDGEPWFVAADVCRVLYPRYNPTAGARSYLKGLNSWETKLLTRANTQGLFHGGRGASCLQAVNESGLYKLIMRANTTNPEAREFQDWVTRDVLPAIRKTGGYLLNEEAREKAHADDRAQMPLPEEFLNKIRGLPDGHD